MNPERPDIDESRIHDAEIVALHDEMSSGNSVGLDDVVDAFQRRLYLPDPTVIYVVLGALAANYLPGDPVWLLLVGAPGKGKTEVLHSLRNVPNVHEVATFTEASLLSGTSEREHAGDAEGGLLIEIGEGQLGIMLAKDFGSVLSMHRDARGQLLAALREIYDGSWTRRVGTDGGRRLHWHGKVGLIAGCTQAIDKHHSVIAAMGDRFLLFRLPGEIEDQREEALAQAALDGSGDEHEMRMELAEVVAAFLAGIRDKEPRERTPEEDAFLIRLARLVVRARSAVDRSGTGREIELVPDAEAPTRFVKQLERLLAGLDVIGLPRDEALQIVGRVALHNMPGVRLACLDFVYRAEGPVATREIAAALDYPTTTIRRTLEDLTAHKVLKRTSQGQGKDDLWQVKDWVLPCYESALGTRATFRVDPAEPTSPEISDRAQETPPEMSDGVEGARLSARVCVNCGQNQAVYGGIWCESCLSTRAAA
jgi:FaeA-like protein